MHCLSHLLPYEPKVKVGKRLKDGLNEYLLLLTAMENALFSLLHDELEHFDPLVGENACQIRALKLALFLNEPLHIQDLIKNVDYSKKIVNELLNSISHFDLETSLQDILELKNLDIPLCDKGLYFIKSYLLSKVKTRCDSKPDLPLVKNEYTDTKKIKEIGNVGTMFSENLVKSLREKVSRSSVRFVQKIASELTSFESDRQMVSNKYSIHHRGLECIPCYWMTKVLMDGALQRKVPIVLLVEQLAKDHNYQVTKKMMLAFTATENGYKDVEVSSLDPNIPVLVFMGKCCGNLEELPEEHYWRQQLLTLGPINLILAYAATHRQYPGSSTAVLDTQDENYEYYKIKSHEWGCSMENPSLFFLAHAYCNKIKNIQF